jgi:hypothetical protein
LQYLTPSANYSKSNKLIIWLHLLLVY